MCECECAWVYQCMNVFVRVRGSMLLFVWRCRCACVCMCTRVCMCACWELAHRGGWHTVIFLLWKRRGGDSKGVEGVGGQQNGQARMQVQSVCAGTIKCATKRISGWVYRQMCGWHIFGHIHFSYAHASQTHLFWLSLFVSFAAPIAAIILNAWHKTCTCRSLKYPVVQR